MGKLMCWWSLWRSEKRTRFIGVCDWKNQAVLLLCHTKVLVFWKIIESKLNNTFPGTNEMTLVENWFYCSVLRLSDTIFFLALSLGFLLSEFSSCLCAFLVALFPPCAHTHTHVHTHFTEECWEISKVQSSIISFQRGRKMRGCSGFWC